MLGPFSIKFPIVTLKIYHHRKEKSYRGSRVKRQFWKCHDEGNNLGGCIILGCDKGKNKHSLSLSAINIEESLKKKDCLKKKTFFINSKEKLCLPQIMYICF